MIKPVLLTATLLLTGCEDPNNFDADAKARLIANYQASMDELNSADEMIRALDRPGSKLDRQHRRDAAERNARMQNMMDTLQNLDVKR